MKKSVRYNPFVYIKDDVDVIRLATNIMANTKAKYAGTGGDPFFDTAAQSLLEDLMHYVCDFYKNIPKKRNFRTLMELLAMSDFEIDPETMQSKKCSGLYIAGEIADVDGACGGFNLQWAWASGMLAGELK